MLKKYHRDVWVGLVLLIFCAFSGYTSLGIKGEAKVVPVALSVLMALCALKIILNGFRFTKEAMGEDFKYPLTVKDSKYAFLYMAFIFVYYLGFRYITYWIVTPIFMFISMKLLKVKSWKVNLIITVVYIIVCYIMFVVVLHLPIYKVGMLGRMFRYR